jgi:hypothetical protein
MLMRALLALAFCLLPLPSNTNVLNKNDSLMLGTLYARMTTLAEDINNATSQVGHDEMSCLQSFVSDIYQNRAIDPSEVFEEKVLADPSHTEMAPPIR